jgi:hypothetical protein
MAKPKAKDGLIEKDEAKQMLSEILRREDLKPATFDRALTLYGKLQGWDTPSPAENK